MRSKWVALTLALFLSVPLLACQDEGPAERMGREVGEAADESKEAADRAADEFDE